MLTLKAFEKRKVQRKEQKSIVLEASDKHLMYFLISLCLHLHLHFFFLTIMESYVREVLYPLQYIGELFPILLKFFKSTIFSWLLKIPFSSFTII